MRGHLYLYSAPGTEWVFKPVQDTLQVLFPELKVSLCGILVPIKTAFDTFRLQYDVTYLLTQIPQQLEGILSLWAVSVDLFAPGKVFIFGAAGQRKAIISTYLLNSLSAVSKVAAHEVGHLLGLSHCGAPCIMWPAQTPEDVERRQMTLCSSCRKEFGYY